MSQIKRVLNFEGLRSYMLTMFLTVFFSVISTIAMSYITLSLEIGPWVAPIFIIVLFLFLIPAFDKRWLQKHAMVMIATGSIGGMIGSCLAMSIPAFYLLHKDIYLHLLATPWKFISVVTAFVLVVGLCAFVMAYLLRYALVEKVQAPFPMSHMIYQMIYTQNNDQARALMGVGFGASAVWNLFLWMTQAAFAAYTAQLHMAPMLASVGFVAGKIIAIPMLIGFLTRVIMIDWLQGFSRVQAYPSVILMTFCSGILVAWFVHVLVRFISQKNIAAKFKSQVVWLYDLAKQKWYMRAVFASLIAYVVFLKFSGFVWFEYLYLLIIILWLSKYVVQIIAELGVVEFHNYVWFALFPLVCFSFNTTLGLTMFAMFVMLFLGIVLDAVFASKLAWLANVSYGYVLKYQVIAGICSAITSGIFFWWCSQYFDLDSLTLFTRRAHDLTNIIQSGQYNHEVFISGFVYGLLLHFAIPEILTVIGAILMPSSMSVWLIIPAAFAHLIKNRQRLYPVCFGIYAGNIVWLLAKVGI